MEQINLVAIQAFATQLDADFAKSLLESAGIDAMIQADRAGGMRDHLAWSGFGFKLLVREEDVAEAREALHPHYKAPEGKLVTVQWCGTRNEAEVMQGALESAGIASSIEAVATANAHSSMIQDIFRVLVAEKDAAAAREILEP
jgi:hypothetical protein